MGVFLPVKFWMLGSREGPLLLTRTEVSGDSGQSAHFPIRPVIIQICFLIKYKIEAILFHPCKVTLLGLKLQFPISSIKLYKMVQEPSNPISFLICLSLVRFLKNFVMFYTSKVLFTFKGHCQVANLVSSHFKTCMRDSHGHPWDVHKCHVYFF